jgi:hypothetical protein
MGREGGEKRGDVQEDELPLAGIIASSLGVAAQWKQNGASRPSSRAAELTFHELHVGSSLYRSPLYLGM